MHCINPLPSHSLTNQLLLTTSLPITIYVNEVGQEDSPEPMEQEAQQEQETLTAPYSTVPRSESTVKADQRLTEVQNWLETLNRPEGITDTEYKIFMCYCTEFFIFNNQLWQKDSKGQHKMVIAPECHLFLIFLAHNNIGHHGVYATNALLMEQYWWPLMAQDIAWYILTCHLCQL